MQRKLGLTATAALSTNALSIQLVDFVNDVCNELSDYGNWQEMLISANITAVSGQSDYQINTSGNVKNIGDIYFSTRRGPIRNVTIQDMRIMTRVTATGTPTQYCVFGVDAGGNPVIRVRPTPAANEAGSLFSITYYVRTPKYTTASGAVRVPFPGDLMVLGVLAKQILNESGGAITDRYTRTYTDYLQSTKETLNRFNSDTGWDVSFVTSRRR